MRKPISFVRDYPSSSKPGVEYTTIMYTDGSTSCNCPGWTRRVASDGSRTCKHVRDLVALAQKPVRVTKSYSATRPVLKPVVPKPQTFGSEERPVRRFNFDED